MNFGRVALAKVTDSIQLQALQTQQKGMQDSIASVNRSKAKYEASAGSLFYEDWTDLTSWATPATPGVQVSAGKLFSTGSGGGASGANHAYELKANESLRVVCKVSLPSNPSSGGVAIGVSKDAPGAIPTAGGGGAYAVYLSSSGLRILDNGANVTPVEGGTMTAGDYVISITADPTYISLSAVKTDGSIEVSHRKLRADFPVNNIFAFNSDSRGLSGAYAGKLAARKGMSTIADRSDVEGITKTIHWTGDGTQSFRIYLPKSYDSRVPSPVAICFHGNGTDETQWSINTNMKSMQKALVDAGYIVLTCSLNASKTTWGNAASTNAYYQAYRFLKHNYSIGPVVFYANSMGGIESLNALAENKIPCNAWIGTVPAYDLWDNYQNPLFTAAIKGAYGINLEGTDYEEKTSGRDPAKRGSMAFRCVPMMVLAPPDDTSVPKATNGDKLVKAVEGVALEVVNVTVPNGGHSFSIEPYKQQMLDFFSKYADVGVGFEIVDYPIPKADSEPGKPVVTISRSKWYQGVLNTTDADTTFRTKHVALCDCHSLQLVYGNFYLDDDPVRLSSLAPYTLKVVIEIPGTPTRFYDVTFGLHGFSIVVQPGMTVTSDPVGMSLRKGDVFYVRAHVLTESPGKFPHGLVAFPANGEGKMAGDQTKSTEPFTALQVATLNPLAIYGTPAKKGFEVVVCSGDSISVGAGVTTAIDNHPQGDVGYMQLAAMRSGRGYMTIGMNGEYAGAFVEFKRLRRMNLANGGDIVICNYGTNDIARTQAPTLEEIQGQLLDMWAAFKMRGLRVYHCTIVPRTNSTDGWKTAENQTPISERAAGGPDSVRSKLNDWIRTVKSPYLDGYIETADIVETARNSGIWKPNTTADGVHPNTDSHILMADATLAVIGRY